MQLCQLCHRINQEIVPEDEETEAMETSDQEDENQEIYIKVAIDSFEGQAEPEVTTHEARPKVETYHPGSPSCVNLETLAFMLKHDDLINIDFFDTVMHEPSVALGRDIELETHRFMT